MALRMMTEKVMGFAAKQYQSALGASLATTGKFVARGLCGYFSGVEMNRGQGRAVC
eukprot:CAMPEP_0178693412 /NCGR_PEP_ID=MMETSP0699-20121125/7698_1 /TAXON_ID=265572 /ORGANISM="Extubocellulus spinifer, Strain CCMP396" /LENGTH=55 /DNA_ID=CAMNT_0020338821 /DNA_START=308 /DNA_END=475 /DNA_ORIENTATION=+